MKKRRTIYIVIAVILIVLNLLVDIVNLKKEKFNQEGDAYNVGYFIGAHFFMITGLVLLRLAYKLTQKIKAAERNAFEENINDIGK
jgi:hypothetical protein